MASAPKEVTLLVLGDGDFSYSLDWARYLKVSSLSYPDQSLHLIATGLDSNDALAAKYKDTNFILSKLKGLDGIPRETNNQRQNSNLRVSIHHDTSAIQPIHRPHDLPPARHLIFNHPHLGTENAALHARFLCHLFHSVSNVWLGENGYFHITLAKGQFQRWSCQEAAVRQDMVLVDQRQFRSPIVISPKYQQRRGNKSGKSFATRTPDGSVTYTFISRRSVEGNNNRQTQQQQQFPSLVTNLLGLDIGPTNTQGGSKAQEEEQALLLFACPHCDKRFREERSRKCHIQSVHPRGDNKKRKRQEDETTAALCCTLCQVKDPKTGLMEPRQFRSLSALEDHQKAKHQGKHTEIKPDWFTPMSAAQPDNDSNAQNEAKLFGSCDICGLKFWGLDEREKHSQSFLPSDATGEALSSFECSHCKKKFRDQRAQKQHENFCSEVSEDPKQTT